MNFKRCLSLFLSCFIVALFLSSSIISAKDSGSDITTMDELRITAQNIEAATDKPLDKETDGDKTVIHLDTNGSPNESRDSATEAAAVNHPPVADLRYVILNADSLTPEGGLTTKTQIAWLWSFSGANFMYDPDGDAITNIQIGGLPSSSILSYATDGTALTGFIVKIPLSGTYTMTFRCQDARGAWSNTWAVTFNIVNSDPVLTKAIACGAYHTVALKEDGTVWTWGWNESGQLGDGTTVDRHTPVKVSGVSGVTAIACGVRDTYVLKEDGTVWAWGYNAQGQLGDGTTTPKYYPVQVSGLTGIKALGSAGGSNSHVLALKEDGTVWAWGANYYGVLGDGTTTARTTPVQVTGLTGVKAIAYGDFISMAIKEDGTAWAWGWNDGGQLGDGTTTPRSTPVQVLNLSGVTGLACGDGITAALLENGTVSTWGSNYWYGLGFGDRSTERSVPVQMPSLNTVKAIAAGYFHAAALKGDGTVWTWGADSADQLLNGAPIKTEPTQIRGITVVSKIACGTYHTVALKGDGTVWAWGLNENGQLGDGTTTTRSDSPVQVIGLN